MPQKCYYCGIGLYGSTPLNQFSKEHVPPRVIYSKVLSQLPQKLQLPTVPSCPVHNEMKCGIPNLDQRIVGNMLYDLDTKVRGHVPLPLLVAELIGEHKKTIEVTKRGRGDVPVVESSTSLTRISVLPDHVAQWIRMMVAATLYYAVKRIKNDSAEQQMLGYDWTSAIILNPWMTTDSGEDIEAVRRESVLNDRDIRIYELDHATSWLPGSGEVSQFPPELFSVQYAVNNEGVLFVRLHLLSEYVSIAAIRGLQPDLMDAILR